MHSIGGYCCLLQTECNFIRIRIKSKRMKSTKSMYKMNETVCVCTCSCIQQPIVVWLPYQKLLFTARLKNEHSFSVWTWFTSRNARLSCTRSSIKPIHSSLLHNRINDNFDSSKTCDVYRHKHSACTQINLFDSINFMRFCSFYFYFDFRCVTNGDNHGNGGCNNMSKSDIIFNGIRHF